MLKHVAKHNQKKAVIIFREVPGDDHMALVAYSDLLPRLVHDEVMKVLESPAGQQAENLADALFRNIMADGRNTLEVMHREGFIKKVPTNQVIVTPDSKNNVRLDELNGILNEMKKGDEAIKRLQELDSGAGMTGKMNKNRKMEPREVGASPASRGPANVDTNLDASSYSALTEGVLSDVDLAAQRLKQAEQMKAQAQQLLAEAQRLALEAAELTPGLESNVKTTKKTKVKAH
jgi:hypothetical protein